MTTVHTPFVASSVRVRPAPPAAPASPAAAARPAGKYVASLDGVRAAAVLAVMGYHFGVPGCSVGWLGVDMFFVLSGFLITTLICRETSRNDGFDLPRFWLRRACRLLPVYWIYLAAVSFLVLSRRIGGWAPLEGWTPGDFVASLWLYFVNLAPGGLWSGQYLTWHLWSLAIEEQFYFVWPAVCVAALRLRRPWLVPAAALGTMLAIYALPVRDPGRAYESYVRTFGIVTGCAFALWFAQPSSPRLAHALTGRAARLASAGLALGIYALAAGLTLRAGGRPTDGQMLALHRFLVPPFVLAFAAFVAGLWHGRPDRLSRALAFAPVAWLGRISYGLYVYHLFLVPLVRRDLPAACAHWHVHLHFWMTVPIYFASVIAVASLSYHVIELPFLRWKQQLSTEPKPSTV